MKQSLQFKIRIRINFPYKWKGFYLQQDCELWWIKRNGNAQFRIHAFSCTPTTHVRQAATAPANNEKPVHCVEELQHVRKDWIQESIATLKHNPITEIGGNNSPSRKRGLWMSLNSWRRFTIHTANETRISAKHLEKKANTKIRRRIWPLPT